MATQKVNLTGDTPVDVKATLSLSDGITYSIQARGGSVLVTEQVGAPTIETVANHRLVPDKESVGAYQAKAGEALYAWAEFGTAALTVTEAP